MLSWWCCVFPVASLHDASESGCPTLGMLVLIDGPCGVSLSYEPFVVKLPLMVKFIFPSEIVKCWLYNSLLLHLSAGIPQRRTFPQLFSYFEMQFIQERPDKCFCSFSSFQNNLIQLWSGWVSDINYALVLQYFPVTLFSEFVLS